MNKTKITGGGLPALWSITPEAMVNLKHEYSAFVNGTEEYQKYCMAGKSIEAIIADLENMPKAFFMRGDIAILPIEGIIFPKGNLFSFFFGGATLDVLSRDLKTLVNDSAVKTIILDIDSPGGVAFGVPEFANMVFEAGFQKPIISITSTMMASAAAWIGAAAEEVLITDEAAMTGSIGVVIEHIDVSEFERKIGIKTTEITAGREKRIASSVLPLTDEGRAVLQKQVDHVYKAFTDDMAKFRKVDIEDVLRDMADGKTFIGSQGIEAGLVDGILSSDDLIDRINAEAPVPAALILKESAGGIITNNFIHGGEEMAITKDAPGKQSVMTSSTFKIQFPDIYAEAFDLGKADATKDMSAKITEAYDKGIDKGLSDGALVGATTEMKRIAAVQEQSIPGFEKEIGAMMFDGVTTGPEAAVKIIQGQKKKQAKGLKSLEDEAVKPVSNEKKKESGKARTSKEKWDSDENLRKEFQDDFDVFEAYEKNLEAGHIKVKKDAGGYGGYKRE